MRARSTDGSLVIKEARLCQTTLLIGADLSAVSQRIAGKADSFTIASEAIIWAVIASKLICVGVVPLQAGGVAHVIDS